MYVLLQVMIYFIVDFSNEKLLIEQKGIHS